MSWISQFKEPSILSLLGNFVCCLYCLSEVQFSVVVFVRVLVVGHCGCCVGYLIEFLYLEMCKDLSASTFYYLPVPSVSGLEFCYSGFPILES